MLNKLILALQLMKNMGLRYIAFRVFFELKKRLGILHKSFPTNPEKIDFIHLNDWKISKHFFIKSREEFNSKDYLYDVDKEMNNKQFNGDFLFFNNLKYSLGKNYDWITNPDTNFKYDNKIHWLNINDFDEKSGDIKYVWEKSRFSFIYLTIRNDIKYKTDSSEFVFEEIKSWIRNNPINQGPNFICSQEISLRTINWYYALQFYRNSDHLTEDLFSEIMHVIYWQIKHVYSNINFSRIAVRNNHAITETLMLYLVGLLFPYFPESEIWKVKGKKWFENEIKYQVYKDGTFLQFSMNYHRVVIQLFNLAITISKYYDEVFSDFVYERAYSSINFLFQCQDSKTGYLPNYGANDGALFFPLTNCDYRDYRPSLNSLHYLLTSKLLYSDIAVQEEMELLNITKPVRSFKVIEKKIGWSEFNEGGYYILNEKDTLTFIRCGNHKDRPSQADNLHVDIWHKSDNVLIDSGTYKYNTSEENVNYFFGTESHNTLMINDKNQMLKGGRFIWFYWTQKVKIQVWVNEDSYGFLGSIKAFKYLNKNIVHQRTIEKIKDKSSWIIIDELNGKKYSDKIRQVWHFNNSLMNENNFNSDAENKILKNGRTSNKYGSYEDSQYLSFESFNHKITTRINL